MDDEEKARTPTGALDRFCMRRPSGSPPIRGEGGLDPYWMPRTRNARWLSLKAADEAGSGRPRGPLWPGRVWLSRMTGVIAGSGPRSGELVAVELGEVVGQHH